LLAEEDFDHRVIRRLLARIPQVDIVTVQEVGLGGRNDRDVLAWAAEQRRVLLTHDVTTMTAHAYDRIAAGRPIPGIFAVQQTAPLGRVIEDLVLLVEASDDDEWDGQVRYLPL
jgi:hypothetical protein